MLGWKPPLFKYKTPQGDADAEEARALKAFLAARTGCGALDDAVAAAARRAASVARLEQALRRLP